MPPSPPGGPKEAPEKPQQDPKRPPSSSQQTPKLPPTGPRKAFHEKCPNEYPRCLRCPLERSPPSMLHWHGGGVCRRQLGFSDPHSGVTGDPLAKKNQLPSGGGHGARQGRPRPEHPAIVALGRQRSTSPIGRRADGGPRRAPGPSKNDSGWKTALGKMSGPRGPPGTPY